MPSAALNDSRDLVYAETQNFKINEQRPLFFCPECFNRMVFVDGIKYIKHFRHYRTSDCEYETEPETEEHFYGKKVVEEGFRSLLKNDPALFMSREYKIADPELGISKYADVYCESKKSGKKVVVEVQQANYDLKAFLDKILFYYYRGYVVVYLFIGNQFGKKINNSKTIYTLKEIENQIFYKKNLPIFGGYLFYEANLPCVEIPQFKPKFRRGSRVYYFNDTDIVSSEVYCKTRFIKEYNPPVFCLNDWLYNILYAYQFNHSKSDLCNCNRTLFLKSEKKIIRYKEVCVYCKRMLRWVPNNEARVMGYEI